MIYVGEAENIIQRLKQHLDGKDYWNEVIVFISKDDHLNKAHIKYLENRFHAIAMESKRYKVMNSTVPTKSTVSEPEQAQLEEFIYNAKILVNTLGHKVFEPVAEEFKTDGAKEKEYFISVGDITAKGIMTSDGFVLLKESQIHKNTAYKSISSGISKLIDQYKADGKVIDSVLTEDVLFTSSSAAAVFVLGYSVSGPKTWKDASGKSLKENEGI